MQEENNELNQLILNASQNALKQISVEICNMKSQGFSDSMLCDILINYLSDVCSGVLKLAENDLAKQEIDLTARLFTTILNKKFK